MRYLLLRNEKSVTDVAEKAYKGLTVKEREKAEIALLKANPELKKFRSVRKGFIVRVPDIHSGGEKNSKNLVDPVESIADEIVDNLKVFTVSLKEKYISLENRQKTIAEKLKVVNKELKNIPKGEEAGIVLRKHLTASKKLNEKNKNLGLEALDKLKKTAESFNR
jgi:hypothetical protein